MYPEIKAAVIAKLREITGYSENQVLDHEPSSVNTDRLIYVILESWDRVQRSGFSERTYRMRARMTFRWQDNEGAERELDQYVDAIPDAIDEDPQFGGRLVRGMARCPEATTDYVDIAGIVYRVLDVVIEVYAKG